MKKILGIILSITFILPLFAPTVTYAASANVTSEGLLKTEAPGMKHDTTKMCTDVANKMRNVKKAIDKKKNGIKIDATDSDMPKLIEEEDEATKESFLDKSIKGTVYSMFADISADFFESVSCKSGISITQLSFTALAKPITITDKAFFMKATNYFLLFSTVIVLYGVLWVGYKFVIGSMEGTDFIKFCIKTVMTLLVLKYLPYLYQDLLNIANVGAHYLSQLPITANMGDGITFEATAVDVLPLLNAYMAGLAYTGNGTGWLQLFLLFTGFLFAIKNFVSIILWSAKRFIWLHYGLFLGYIMISLAINEETSALTGKWIKQVVGEAVSIMFVGIAFFVGGTVLFNVHYLGFYWLYELIIIVVTIEIISKLPMYVADYIGTAGGFKGSFDAYSSLGRGMKKQFFRKGEVVKDGRGNSVGRTSDGMGRKVMNSVSAKANDIKSVRRPAPKGNSIKSKHKFK